MRRFLFLAALVTWPAASLADGPKSAIPVAAPPSAPAYVVVSTPEGAGPVIPPSACESCSSGLLKGKWLRARPEPECFGCSTIRCEHRFIWGSCRAFYGVGRFAPPLPAIDD